MLLDLDMPGLTGVEVIGKAREMGLDTDAIVMTGKSSLESAIAALRHGAFDYITKPTKLADLQRLLCRVEEKRELTNKYRALKRQLERVEGGAKLVGQSDAMNAVQARIEAHYIDRHLVYFGSHAAGIAALNAKILADGAPVY